MKNWISSSLCLLLCLMLFSACLPEGTKGQTPRPASAVPSSAPAATEPQSTPQNEPGEKVTLKMLLPANQTVLGELLTQLASAEGILLELQQGNTYESYSAQAVAALSEPNSPDFFYIDNEADARVLGSWIFEDLSDSRLDPTFGALINMVPKTGRLLEQEKVYGLPLGYYAEGYLVDIEMLAALLGAQNTAVLVNDLTQSTWAQWSRMLAALEIYLQRPASMRIQLGQGIYTTPGYRPRIAQPLRGIFAFADGTPQALMSSALDASVYAPYASADEWLTTDKETVRERLFPSLESLYALMDFETLHMARPEGAVYRGEGYVKRDVLLEEEAQAQFAAGTALLYRSNSSTGLTLEQENPRLKDRLALLPVKLPPPVLPDTGDSSSTSDSSKSENTQPEKTEAEEATAQYTAAAIEEHNVQLWYGVQGYLCLNSQSANKSAVQSLLLRLYTTEEGTSSLVEQLHLHPFSDLLPASTLSQQVSRAAISGEGALLPSSGKILENAQETIGAFVADNLMDKEEWGEDEAYNFLIASLKALGYNA